MGKIVSQRDQDLFLIRGIYGYKGFSEKVGENLYRSDTKGFWEAIDNATNPIDADKVSRLSSGQIKMLSFTSDGNALIPLLNRMGELGMMDFRQGMIKPEIIARVQKNSYASTINVYKKSI